MRPLELLVIYLIVGATVTVTLLRRGRSGAWLALPLWPLFLPSLLDLGAPRHGMLPGATIGHHRIREAATRLHAALAAWDGLPSTPGAASMDDLVTKLENLGERLDRLDEILAAPECRREALEQALREASEEVRPLVLDRSENVKRLEILRERGRQDLEQALAAMASLSTRAWLARFQGDAVEAVTNELHRLAAAVDTGTEIEVLRRAGDDRPHGERGRLRA